jgi:hypothetical protein
VVGRFQTEIGSSGMLTSTARLIMKMCVYTHTILKLYENPAIVEICIKCRQACERVLSHKWISLPVHHCAKEMKLKQNSLDECMIKESGRMQ